MKNNQTKNRGEKELREAENLICPVCGYYCLGKGGHGCIDKKSFCEKITQKHE